jgi:hypothetical protein
MMVARKHDFRQEQNAFWKDTIVTNGLPKHLSGTQIVDMPDKLTPDPKNLGILKGTERCTIGLLNVHYGNFRMCQR